MENQDAKSVIERWLKPSTPLTPSVPENYIKDLSAIQDFLTESLVDLYINDQEKIMDIVSMLSGIIFIKMDLKVFIKKKGGEL
jgi:hypothetical protein